MGKNSKCGCGYKEEKCRCKQKSKNFQKNRLKEAKLGSSSNPLHLALPTQNNEYDVKLNTLFGKNPYRNVLGNFGDLKSQGIGVFFNQGMPSNSPNLIDLDNSNGLDMNNTEDRLGFNSNADLDSLMYDDWAHSIPDQNQDNDSMPDLEEYPPPRKDWEDVADYYSSNLNTSIFSEWNNVLNTGNQLLDAITSPNTTLDQIQDNHASPLDNFLQPVQDNNLVRNLFQTPSRNEAYDEYIDVEDDDDEEEESPILQQSAETGGVPSNYIVGQEEEAEAESEEEESEAEVGTDDDEEAPNNHRWLFYGIMPSFPEFDAIDAGSFSNNAEYDRAIMRVRDIDRRDTLRGMILLRSEGIRGETKSKFFGRTLKSLRELYAKVAIFQEYNYRRNSQP